MAAPYNKRLTKGISEVPSVRKSIYHELEEKGFDYVKNKYLSPAKEEVKKAFAEEHLRRKNEESPF